MKLNKKSNKGFTIIEVLIVLSIAASIILIVFLAVPALQRNQRNAQRKSNIASIAGAINEYESNYSGSIPVGASATQLCDTASCGGTPTKTVDFKQGYYSAAPTVNAALASGGTVAAVTTDTVTIVPKGKCSSTNSAVYGSERSFAILYATEGAGNAYTSQCQEA